MLIFGDILAISMLMHMKDHNGFSPCRMCGILKVQSLNGNTNYIPHNCSRHPDVIYDRAAVKVYDMAHLLLCTHEELLAQAREVEAATSNTDADRLSRQYGIKNIPVLSCLSSIKFPVAFPYDFMHLIWENVIKNLILHWTGEFKGLGEGSGSYILKKSAWQAIGTATAASGSTISSAYGNHVPNIVTDSTFCTAETWSFWTLYLGPVLLKHCFPPDTKYFSHFIKLVCLLNICLQFKILKAEISHVCTGFIKWVQEYEKLYYQYCPERISVCMLTMHGLLHIANSINACGPVWCYWAFPMEHYCGKLHPALREDFTLHHI
ncbi:hypothetical protein BDN70DRAFT_909338 [Pholiota conissans]|uniref:Transposase n=1 Tax=Pholiota conissans TaxID=109636 RepID=A0A9P5YPX0_9AGAR|nr:hypothetical protein BDN70DRAFT_909338 [Pholiota conissans]